VKSTRPLIRIDPGWLFVLAGLSLVLAATIVPSGRQLHDLRMQLEELRHAERENFALMGAYDRFVSDLDDRDPALVRRLAASQLNVIPRGETPILMASTVYSSVPEWIEATVERERFAPIEPPDTLLARWTEGRGRLWAIGAGGFFVFAGLLIGPSSTRRSMPAGAQGSARSTSPESTAMRTDASMARDAPDIQDSVRGISGSSSEVPACGTE